MSQYLKKAALTTLLAGAVLSPQFAQAQAADPCIVTRIIDVAAGAIDAGAKVSVVVTKRRVDYRTERVADYTTEQVFALAAAPTTTYSHGGNAVALSPKPFSELTSFANRLLETERPAACPKSN